VIKRGKNRYNGENIVIKILEKERLMLKTSQKMVQSLEREIDILKYKTYTYIDIYIINIFNVNINLLIKIKYRKILFKFMICMKITN